MKHVRGFALFENEKVLTGKQKEFLDGYTQGSWILNPKTGLVDVNGSFNCSRKELKDLCGIEFRNVTGDFSCYNNKLTSLKGAPREVGGNFFCDNNKLTSLKGAPRKVGGSLSCYDNSLTSLEGAPMEVGEHFFCFRNKLTSLEGAPEKVGWNFYLDRENGFRWKTKGKLEYLRENPKWSSLILPTIAHDSLLAAVSDDPTFLKTIEYSGKVLYNKLLKDLGWDKMGTDLLRQLKNGFL